MKKGEKYHTNLHMFNELEIEGENIKLPKHKMNRKSPSQNVR